MNDLSVTALIATWEACRHIARLRFGHPTLHFLRHAIPYSVFYIKVSSSNDCFFQIKHFLYFNKYKKWIDITWWRGDWQTLTLFIESLNSPSFNWFLQSTDLYKNKTSDSQWINESFIELFHSKTLILWERNNHWTDSHWIIPSTDHDFKITDLFRSEMNKSFLHKYSRDELPVKVVQGCLVLEFKKSILRSISSQIIIIYHNHRLWALYTIIKKTFKKRHTIM